MSGAVARLVAETECAQIRVEVVQRLEASPKAQDEGRQAAWIEGRRQQFVADRAAVAQAQERAAAAARSRVAQALLRERLADVEGRADGDGAGSAVGTRGRGSRVERVLALAGRPLEEELLGATG